MWEIRYARVDSLSTALHSSIMWWEVHCPGHQLIQLLIAASLDWTFKGSNQHVMRSSRVLLSLFQNHRPGVKFLQSLRILKHGHGKSIMMVNSFDAVSEEKRVDLENNSLFDFS